MKKIIHLLLVVFIGVHAIFAQYSESHVFPLDEASSFQSIVNVELTHEGFQKMKPRKDAFLLFESIVLTGYDEQPFVAVAPSFSFHINTKHTQLYVRFQIRGEWSDWQAVVADEHAPIDRFVGEQLYVDAETQAVQYKIELYESTSWAAHNFKVDIYYPGKTPAVSLVESIGKPKSGHECDCDMPAHLDRLGWCPIPFNCPQQSNPTLTDVTHLIVHHSAGTNTSTDWSAVVRAIWNHHVNTNGWADIGYNYLIDPNGVIYEGRGNNVVGAHFSCMNPRTMGVCLLGNFQTATPTQAMLNSLTELLGWKTCEIDADPTASTTFAGSGTVLNIISGHRDANGIPNSCTSTVCPGDNMYPLLPNLRIGVDGYIDECELQPEPQNSDIVVISMQSNPQSPVAGEVAQLQVRLRNVGAAAITQPFSTSFRIAGAEVGTVVTSSLAAATSVDLSVNYTFSASGTFQYCVFADGAHNETNTANNSFCVNVTVQPAQEQPNSIGGVNNDEIVVYPNPAKDILHITTTALPEKVVIYNSLGQTMHEQSGANAMQADVSAFPAGLYILQLQYEHTLLERKVWVE
jgi:hypothetical protein